MIPVALVIAPALGDDDRAGPRTHVGVWMLTDSVDAAVTVRHAFAGKQLLANAHGSFHRRFAGRHVLGTVTDEVRLAIGAFTALFVGPTIDGFGDAGSLVSGSPRIIDDAGCVRIAIVVRNTSVKREVGADPWGNHHGLACRLIGRGLIQGPSRSAVLTLGTFTMSIAFDQRLRAALAPWHDLGHLTRIFRVLEDVIKFAKLVRSAVRIMPAVDARSLVFAETEAYG